jgi:nucleoside-diphosphate kinase
MVWSGKGVVKSGRVLLGETNPLASLPGTIRGGKLSLNVLR